MLFSKRESRIANYAMASSTAVAVLSQLRQQAFPLAMDVPSFSPPHMAQPGTAAGEWLGGLPRNVARQALFAAAFAAVVLFLAITIPAWAAFHSAGSTSSSPTALRSSAGVTGTASMRIGDLSAATFVGNVPFMQQIRYVDNLTSSNSAGAQFVQGARESSMASYMQGIATNLALPYLSDAVATKQRLDNYYRAYAAQQAAQAAKARQTAAASSPLNVSGGTAGTAVGAVWHAPAIEGGTTLASTITFYACVGNGFCGHMANGQSPFLGAAACSTNLPMGTQFVINGDPSGRVYTCLDRGALSATWVDVWFYNAADGYAWQSIVGSRATITILP